MPIQSIKHLPHKAQQIYEKVYSEIKKKGKSDSQSSKIAWGAVKRLYVNKDGKWVIKEEMHEKSSLITQQIHEKSIDGKTYLEGYIFTFDPDNENEIISYQLGQQLYKDINFGGLYHEDTDNDLLRIKNKKLDDKGLYALVEVNKDSSKYNDAIDIIKNKPNKLAFSVRFTSPLYGKRVVEKDGKYYSEILEGKGLDFCLTDRPNNINAKATLL